MVKSNEEKSLSKTIKLHSVEIKKMPCGKYFEALQTLKDLPEDFIKELSSEGDFKLSEMLTVENIMDLVVKLMIIAPKFLFSFLSKILDVEEEILKNQLTPTELLEVCKEFWKVNKLESFFDQMKPIMKEITTLIGFKGLLQSVSK
ncbi:MAG: hypothetical protein HFJ20_03010 [Clostridia bacterium]|nr:hypothetical protein [Clostridia bacterium]